MEKTKINKKRPELAHIKTIDSGCEALETDCDASMPLTVKESWLGKDVIIFYLQKFALSTLLRSQIFYCGARMPLIVQDSLLGKVFILLQQDVVIFYLQKFGLLTLSHLQIFYCDANIPLID